MEIEKIVKTKLHTVYVDEHRKVIRDEYGECTLVRAEIPYIIIKGLTEQRILFYSIENDRFNFNTSDLFDLSMYATKNPEEIVMEVLELKANDGTIMTVDLEPGMCKVNENDKRYRMCDDSSFHIVMETKVLPFVEDGIVSFDDGAAMTLFFHLINNMSWHFFDNEDDDDDDDDDEYCEGCTGKCGTCNCKCDADLDDDEDCEDCTGKCGTCNCTCDADLDDDEDENDEDYDICDITDEHLVNIGCTGNCSTCTDTCDGYGDEEDDDDDDDCESDFHCSSCDKYDHVNYICKCDSDCKTCSYANDDVCDKCKDCDFSLCVHRGNEDHNNFQPNVESLYPKTIRETELQNTIELPKVILNKEQSLKLKKKRK